VSENELGWFALVIVLLILDLALVLVAAWGWAGKRRAEQEADYFSNAWAAQQDKTEVLLEWQTKAINFIISHPQCMGEALAAGLVSQEPETLGSSIRMGEGVRPVYGPVIIGEEDTKSK